MTEAQAAESLVERILKGDQTAEQEMVERYNRGVLFMLRHRSKNRALAEDISQETWRIVLQKVRAGDLKDHSRLSAFIVQTAKNQLLMHYRSSHQTKVTLDDKADETVDMSDQPQQVLEKYNLAQVVKKLVSELKTPRDRELIMRFYLQEEDKQSICQDYQLSELHFNRVLFRARQRFKELWVEHIGEHR
jgi:RNA polymerase sigma-70 factor (ECF subfamily)